MASALTKVGRYQIVSERGRGSMGIVYAAFDPVIGRTIAIKTMLTEGLGSAEFREFKARFQREAQAAGVLSHPNIVTVYDFGEDSGVLYLAMEYLEGKTLQQLMDEQSILQIEAVIPIYEQVCSALDLAHCQKIVHRDLKPANIMILDSGLVKVTDFGIAKIMSMGMTAAGQIVGTPNYMSPEQVRGGAVDGRADIFSLGVILYELVTGERPFSGQNITTVIYKIIHENPIPPRELNSSVHTGLNHVIGKALAKNPDERYQTCREFASQLRNYKSLRAPTSTLATVAMKVPSGRPASPPPYAPSWPAPDLPAAPPAPSAMRQPAAPAVPVGEYPIGVPPPHPAPSPVVHPPAPKPRGRSPAIWVILALLLAVGGLGVGYYFLRVKSRPTLTDDRVHEPPKPPVNPQPLPKLGVLYVTSNVPEAKISIDGRSEPGWTAPHEFPGLQVGGHQVVISKEGYRDVQQTITIEEGRKVALEANLTSASPTGTQPAEVQPGRQVPPTPPKIPPAQRVGALEVAANIEGARISLDGKSNPSWVTPYTFNDLSPGTHAVVVSKEGYETTQTDANVEAGQVKSARLELTTPTGEINIVTIPPGAEVIIDGKPVGTSPYRATLPVGPHVYVVKIVGAVPYEKKFNIENGGILTSRVDLSGSVSAPTGIVEVRSDPPGATVYADGSPAGGKTPTSFYLRGGHHTLTISLRGFASVHREIDVSANESTAVQVTLSPQ